MSSRSGTSEPLRGRCLCGDVRFLVRGELGAVNLCHCSRCRRVTGSAFSANCRVRGGGLEFLSGREGITEWDWGHGWRIGFCARCGSRVYARNVDDPHSYRVRLGSLEGDPGVRPGSHVWVGSKAPWSPIGPALPCFEEARPPGAGG